jgi:hypothetical protein
MDYKESIRKFSLLMEGYESFNQAFFDLIQKDKRLSGSPLFFYNGEVEEFSDEGHEWEAFADKHGIDYEDSDLEVEYQVMLNGAIRSYYNAKDTKNGLNLEVIFEYAPERVSEEDIKLAAMMLSSLSKNPNVMKQTIRFDKWLAADLENDKPFPTETKKFNDFKPAISYLVRN